MSEIYSGSPSTYFLQWCKENYPAIIKVNINVIANGNGTVTGSGTYVEGDTVTITATPAEGYIFIKWQEDGSKETSRDLIITKDMQTTYTALFEVITPTKIVDPVTGIEYDSFTDAIAAAEPGATIKLQGNTVLEQNTATQLTKDINIDMNGLTMSNNFSSIPSTNGLFYTTAANPNVKLNIVNGSFELDLSKSAKVAFIRTETNTSADVTLSNVTIIESGSTPSNGTCVVNVRGGTAKFIDCTISSDGYQPIVVNGPANGTTTKGNDNTSAFFDNCIIAGTSKGLIASQYEATISINNSVMINNLTNSPGQLSAGHCFDTVTSGGKIVVSNTSCYGEILAYCDYATDTKKNNQFVIFTEPKDLFVFNNVSANGILVQRWDGAEVSRLAQQYPDKYKWPYYLPFTINGGKYDGYNCIDKTKKLTCGGMGTITEGSFEISSETIYNSVIGNLKENSTIDRPWDGEGIYIVTQN